MLALIFATSQSNSRAYSVFANESREFVAALTSSGFTMAPSRVSIVRVSSAFSSFPASTIITAAASASAPRASSPASSHPSSSVSLSLNDTFPGAGYRQPRASRCPVRS